MPFDLPPGPSFKAEVFEVRFASRNNIILDHNIIIATKMPAQNQPAAPAPASPQHAGNINFKPKVLKNLSDKDWLRPPLKSMSLPPEWCDSYPWSAPPAEMYDFDFHPFAKKDQKATITFSCRGRDCSEQDRQALSEALASPGKIDPKLVQSLFAGGQPGQNFETVDWNGRPVIETFRTEKDGYKSWTLFYNGNKSKDDRPYLSSLTFSAPPALYQKYIAAVKKSFKTIKWQ